MNNRKSTFTSHSRLLWPAVVIVIGCAGYRVHAQQGSLDTFTYIEVDNSRQLPKAFGLATGDVTGDGLADIVSGRYFYRNPWGVMSGPWPRTVLAGKPDVDAMLMVDVDRCGDVIAEWLPNVYWLEATDEHASEWLLRATIGQIPLSRHNHHGQGFITAQLVKDGTLRRRKTPPAR